MIQATRNGRELGKSVRAKEIKGKIVQAKRRPWAKLSEYNSGVWPMTALHLEGREPNPPCNPIEIPNGQALLSKLIFYIEKAPNHIKF